MTLNSDEFPIVTILAWSQKCRYTESQLYRLNNEKLYLSRNLSVTLNETLYVIFQNSKFFHCLDFKSSFNVFKYS